MRRRTKVYSAAERRIIFDKTQGVCHFCGDPLIFEKYDLRREEVIGSWNIDHVNQRWKGGAESIENCLPACVTCNRLRWNRPGANLREALFLGIIAIKEMRRGSVLGKQLEVLKDKRIAENLRRRRPRKETPVADVDGLAEI
jgi:hypothetical protein